VDADYFFAAEALSPIPFTDLGGEFTRNRRRIL
jgi:hypothetical protein